MLLFSIITEYSLWLLPLCLSAGAGYALLLYRNEHSFDSVNKNIKKLLWTIRFLTVSVISFLLLSPFSRSENKLIEKPLVIIARDNSESIMLAKDSGYYKSGFIKDIEQLKSDLKEKCNVKELFFDAKCSDSLSKLYAGDNTDFSQLFSYIANKYYNYNLGAVIVASDGIATKGATPVYAASSQNIKTPVYSVAMGDTVAFRDLAIVSVKHNQIAFEGNTLQFEMQVNTRKCKGETMQCTLSENNQKLFEKKLPITNDNQFLSIPVEIGSQKAGLHHYTFTVSRLKDEHTYKNNSKEFVIEVIKNKQKILFVYNSPHPDIAAVKRALETNKNYAVDLVAADAQIPDVSGYNLIIASQLPSRTNALTQILQNTFKNEIPILILSGLQTDFQKLGALFPGFIIQSRYSGYDETQLICNSSFPFFELDEDERRFLEQCPPLATPFASFNKETAEILGFQKINSIETDKPLWVFFNRSDSKSALLLGEGIWKWRVSAYKMNGSFELFDRFITKVVNYLAINVRKTKFIVTVPPVFGENERVVFHAELYNDSYELVNTPEISLTIRNAKGTSYPYVFARTAKSYNLEIGQLPKGDYTFASEVKYGAKTYKQSGSFSVLPVNVESEYITARHNELFALSELNNGKMYNPHQLKDLARDLAENEELKPVSHFDKAMKDWVDSPLLFICMVALMAIEWFLRKYHGGY